MNLHILINGKPAANYDVAPERIPFALRAIDERLDALRERGRVAVTLDSVINPGLTYILLPRPSA